MRTPVSLFYFLCLCLSLVVFMLSKRIWIASICMSLVVVNKQVHHRYVVRHKRYASTYPYVPRMIRMLQVNLLVSAQRVKIMLQVNLWSLVPLHTIYTRTDTRCARIQYIPLVPGTSLVHACNPSDACGS